MTAAPLRIAYLFTIFPVLSETFYQREVRALRARGADVAVWSLWCGARRFEGAPVRRFPPWRWAALVWLLPYWLARRPEVFRDLARRLADTPMPSALNAGETLLGLLFALAHAGRFARERPDVIHAAWATAPATAAEVLSALTGIPFTTGAHAYDVFRHGGDWLLPGKLAGAARIVTSSEATRRALIDRGAPPARTVLVRRVLDDLPPLGPARPRRRPLRILAVGRLVEMKGYAEQLGLYAAFEAAGLDFEARIVGGGRLGRALRRRAAALGLAGRVRFLGPLTHREVRAHYAWADVLLFTGRVARNGDRDGLPNVIAEAMAFGAVVLARDVAGVGEAVVDGETGILITSPGAAPWLAALRRLQDDDRLYENLRAGGHAWVAAHFDARRNAAALLAHFAAAAESAVAGHDWRGDLVPA